MQVAKEDFTLSFTNGSYSMQRSNDGVLFQDIRGLYFINESILTTIALEDKVSAIKISKINPWKSYFTHLILL